jgi:hypothetical protein
VLSQYPFIYEYALQRQAELLREAELARLARAHSGPRRPLRVRIADVLYALADRIDSRSAASAGIRVTA